MIINKPVLNNIVGVECTSLAVVLSMKGVFQPKDLRGNNPPLFSEDT